MSLSGKRKQKELDQIEIEMEKAVKAGLMEVGIKDGTKYYRITKSGEEFVKNMPFKKT